MSEASRKLKINHKLDYISDRIARGIDHNLLDFDGIRILFTLDRIDREYFEAPDSIYSLIDGCNREEISGYISSLNAESTSNCIGQMQDYLS